MEPIAERYARLRERIAAAAHGAGRSPTEVRLIAISKTVTPEHVRAAAAAGLRVFGENRAQELRAKTDALADLALEWHFVGHLQTNKVRLVLPRTHLIHSVDRIELARKISLRATPDQPHPILVQVNTTAEPSKSGIAPAELPTLLDQIAALPALRVDGLMTIGPLSGDRTTVTDAFRRLRQMRDTERAVGRPQAPLRELSMGMSGDFEIAIAEGATLLRIGTAIFGPRA